MILGEYDKAFLKLEGYIIIFSTNKRNHLELINEELEDKKILVFSNILLICYLENFDFLVKCQTYSNTLNNCK